MFALPKRSLKPPITGTIIGAERIPKATQPHKESALIPINPPFLYFFYKKIGIIKKKN